MNYTPTELQNVTFKKSLIGGYNEDEVNKVLDSVIEDYNTYIHENIELKDKVSVLNEAVQRSNEIEKTLKDTLIVAQQTAEEIKQNAYKNAENIIKEAQIQASQLVSDANEKVLKISYEYEKMRKELTIYKVQSKNLLITQLESLMLIADEKDEGPVKTNQTLPQVDGQVSN